MTDTRRALLLHGWAHTVLIAALVLVLNHLSSTAFLRLDLTADQRHGLSDVAKQSVAALQRPLLARVYFSEDLAAPYHDHRRALLDKLEELSVHAGGRLELEAIDPASDPEVVAEAARAGVRPLPYAFRSWDRTEARTVYMGVSLTYGDQQVAIDALPSIEAMEVELVRAIRRVTTEPEDARAVGWLLGHGEPDPTQAPADAPLSELLTRLQRSGELRTIAPSDAPIPEDLDALIVVAPQRPLEPAELVHLDQYLMRGGALLLWISNVQPDFAARRLRAVEHGLYGWLGHHGIRLSRDVLLDREHTEQMVVPMEVEGLGAQLVRLNYPLAMTTTRLDRTARPVRDLPRAVLPFASSLAPADPLPGDLQAQIWVESMPASVSVRGLSTLDPRALRQPLPDEQAGPHPVAIALSGTFDSWAVGRPPPPRLDPQAEPFEPDTWRDRSRPTRMVVVSSGDALANNLDLTMNALDWLLDDPALIEIRSRGGAAPVLKPPPRATARWVKLAVVGTPLLILALIALGVRWRRAS